MAYNAYDRYLEAEVLSADPAKLVWLLYRGAIDAARTASACIATGDIRGRAHQINRAWNILQELTGSLKPVEGDKIGGRLAGLYCYLQGRLIEANVKQTPEPLDEVISLLTTLSEAWAPNLSARPEAAETKGSGSAVCSYGQYREDETERPALHALA